MIIFGTRLFGRCDEIEGVGHVATQFFHIYFFPLYPVTAVFVFNPNEGRYTDPAEMLCCEVGQNGQRVGRIPIHCRSIGMAYFQACAMVAGVVALTCGLVNASNTMNNDQPDGPNGSYNIMLTIVLLLGGCLSFAASYAAYLFGRHASFERAQDIAERLGRRDILAKVHAVYGQREATSSRVNDKRRRKGQNKSGVYNGVATQLSNDDTETEAYLDDEDTIDGDVPIADALLVNGTGGVGVQAGNNAPAIEMVEAEPISV